MCVERNSGKFEERLGFGSRVRVLGSPVNIKPSGFALCSKERFTTGLNGMFGRFLACHLRGVTRKHAKCVSK